MNGLPYYPRYPRDFLDGTVGMSLEEKGAYGIVLDLIYMMGDRGLMDDPQFIAGHLGCSVRKWNGIRNRLVETGKLVIENGVISNFRADKEKIIQRKFQDKQRENATKSNKSKDLQKPRASHTDTDTDIRDDTNVSSRRFSKNEGFDAFWDLWPSKKNKQNARKAWRKLSIDDKRAAYRAVLNGWFDQWQAGSPDANPIHASTFLNARRWEDQPNAPKLRPIEGGRNNAKRPIAERLEARFAEMDCGSDRNPSKPLFSPDDGRPDRGGGDVGLDSGAVWLFSGTDQRSM